MRAAPAAAASPSARPMATSSRPLRMTSLMTCPGCPVAGPDPHLIRGHADGDHQCVRRVVMQTFVNTAVTSLLIPSPDAFMLTAVFSCKCGGVMGRVYETRVVCRDSVLSSRVAEHRPGV